MRGDDGDLTKVVEAARRTDLTGEQLAGLAFISQWEREVFDALEANPTTAVLALEHPRLSVLMHRARRWWSDGVYVGDGML